VSGIPVTGINELVLEVADLDAAARFYTEVLGLPVQARSDERVWVLAGERTRIGLWTPQVGIAGGQGGAHVHYALHIAEDAYDAAVQRLRDQGFEPHEEDFEENGRAAYVTDPDGNVVELWTWAG
jgi:catechol 2,3-dioxygenase-like lactoylglutathione lyase family enzyme